MKLYCCVVVIFGIVLLSFGVQQNPIHKKWKLVAEEQTYFNFDYTRLEGSRNRLDSIKNETVWFKSDGSFTSGDGDGTYTISKDSISLHLHGKETSFKYVRSQDKLIMEKHFKESRFIIRSRLFLE